jgi:hypothetical protein
MVVHICNPNYLGGGDWEGHGLRPARAKSSQDSISMEKMLSMVVYACHPSDGG